MKMSDEHIKHMVNRFLSWKLPDNFNPDAGITFKATFNEHTSHPAKHQPTGTNLFDAVQADAMVRYMADGMPHDDVRVQLQDDAASLAAQLGEARNEIAKLTRELLMANERSKIYKRAVENVAGFDGPAPLNMFAAMCHADNRIWWHDPKTGEPLARNHGELMMLMVSEIAEAMEGDRKSLMDSHIPHRRSVEVEFADLLIRLFDYAGAYKFDLDGAFQDKRAYNAVRADHKPEARLAEGGKKY